MRRVTGPGIGLVALGFIVGVSPGSAQSTLEEPFTPDARWSHYLHLTFGPTRLALLSVDTAFDHAMREPACWDSAASSYGRRFARSFSRRIIGNTTELAGGLVTGEDLRYRPMRSGNLHNRVWHAVRSSVTAQMPGGTERPAYTRFFASGVANLSTAHWTGQSIQPGW